MSFFHEKDSLVSLNFDKFALELNKSMIMAHLNRIKAVLAEQDKTGKWLADQLGKSTCTVSKWCKNSAQPDLKTLNEIANALNINIKDLLVSNSI